ncbi:excinuclease ABC subunit UvrC [Microbacteriaceae bacterium K1510]|nr:excinuclease ABC subunit UvrC [Microbacteriaceae bacterium K1510]
MNGKRDIDTASEDLREEDDEQTLPELELTDAPAGTLAAGRAAIARAVKHAPSSPGVYRMIDEKGDVLYVGKAKNIKKRVTNYTRPVAYDARIARMIAGTVSMEFVTTKTETEALLLEANLIKRLRPRFNVLLRDDKSFPYILITSDHWAPQILKHRGARSRPGHYYGPFANAGAVNRTINALQRAFLLRSCSDSFFESRTRPCLLYQIKRCSAPCTREIDFAGYSELVREANEFLSGHSRTVQKELAEAMDKASNALDFEHAAIFRDRLAALSAVQSHQGINPRSVEEADVFAVHQAGGYNCIEVFFFRTGQNWGNRAYFPKADRALAEGEVLSAFMAQFYDDKPPPRLVLVSHDFEERALMADALTTKAGRKVEVSVPQRGERKELVQHALANAREALARKLADTSSQQKLLKGLAEAFGLPRDPRRIEVYDNSHIAGTNAVGGMIVASPEGFRKNQYRKFNIRSTDLTPGDDYGMMREVLQRRFKRLLEEAPRVTHVPSDSTSEPHTPSTSPLVGEVGAEGAGRGVEVITPSESPPSLTLPQRKSGLPDLRKTERMSGEPDIRGGGNEIVERDDHIESDERDESPWPDLVLIDGGQGQLKAAVDTLTEMGITDVPLVSIAKGMDREAGRETFFMPGKAPFKLPPRDPLLYYIERLRDEAHRFAIGSHRARRKKDIREAGLQEIPGIGPTRKRALLRHFGTVKAIERASLPDLANVPGINAETARKIYEFFHEQGAR